ncbi:MAG: hypothetical protein IPO17_08060 [Flavobacteriales bacterium]|nr:hypothetical protein [Flavobacteriales bacterium]
MNNELSAPAWQQRLWNALFFCILFLYCAVVAEGRFFPTVDGPVHTYNARLFGDLMALDVHATSFFHFNDAPVPYWTSTVLMWLFGTLFGPAEVERIMVLLIVIATALSYRWFLRAVSVESNIGSLLIYPFLWAVPLQLGFFNYCLGFALLFFTLGWWLHRMPSQRMDRVVLQGSVLFMVLFFTHLMFFVLGLALITGHAVWLKLRMRQVPFLRKLLSRLLMTAFPAILLLIWYMITDDGEGPHAATMSFAQRLEWLVNGQSLLTLVWEQEQPMVRLVQGGLLLLTLGALWSRRNDLLTAAIGDAWGLAAVAFFAACLVLPDGFSTGTIVLVRLQLIGLVLWATWCAAQRMNEGVRIVGVGLAMAGALWQLHFHWGTVRALRLEAEDLYTVHTAIGDGATVLPLNYSDNWLHGNFSDYLGTWRNTIVLDNFVARFSHSPIQWNTEMEPFADIGNFDNSLQPCVDLDAWTLRTGHTIDHVITVRMPEQPTDSCTLDTEAQLKNRYELSFTSPTGNVKLYSLLDRQ